MKKIVLTFGLISGVIMSALMTAVIVFAHQTDPGRGMLIGYTIMVLSFLLVFFGIRSYRENVGNGYISFGRALAVGFLIMLISCVCYVITWEVVYHKFMPDFGEKYLAQSIERVRASGKSPQEIESEIENMRSMMQLYNSNILFNIAFTLLEPLPPGLVMTLISALILRKRRREERGEEQDLQDYRDGVKETSVNPV
jgi:protein-S-isoprenylcysteine O-methyltransferase Ste14